MFVNHIEPDHFSNKLVIFDASTGLREIEKGRSSSSIVNWLKKLFRNLFSPETRLSRVVPALLEQATIVSKQDPSQIANYIFYLSIFKERVLNVHNRHVGYFGTTIDTQALDDKVYKLATQLFNEQNTDSLSNEAVGSIRRLFSYVPSAKEKTLAYLHDQRERANAVNLEGDPGWYKMPVYYRNLACNLDRALRLNPKQLRCCLERAKSAGLTDYVKRLFDDNIAHVVALSNPIYDASSPIYDMTDLTQVKLTQIEETRAIRVGSDQAKLSERKKIMREMLPEMCRLYPDDPTYKLLHLLFTCKDYNENQVELLFTLPVILYLRKLGYFPVRSASEAELGVWALVIDFATKARDGDFIAFIKERLNCSFILGSVKSVLSGSNQVNIKPIYDLVTHSILPFYFPKDALKDLYGGSATCDNFVAFNLFGKDFAKGKPKDIAIDVGMDKPLTANLELLKNYSKYFDAMLSENRFRESTQKVLRVNITPSEQRAFCDLVQYSQTKEIEVTLDNAACILTLADRYEFRPVVPLVVLFRDFVKSYAAKTNVTLESLPMFEALLAQTVQFELDAVAKPIFDKLLEAYFRKTDWLIGLEPVTQDWLPSPENALKEAIRPLLLKYHEHVRACSCWISLTDLSFVCSTFVNIQYLDLRLGSKARLSTQEFKTIAGLEKLTYLKIGGISTIDLHALSALKACSELNRIESSHNTVECGGELPDAIFKRSFANFGYTSDFRSYSGELMGSFCLQRKKNQMT